MTGDWLCTLGCVCDDYDPNCDSVDFTLVLLEKMVKALTVDLIVRFQNEMGTFLTGHQRSWVAITN